jgi:hypothetical protein
VGLLPGQTTGNPAFVFNGQPAEVIAPAPTPGGDEPSGPAKVCLVRTGKCFTAGDPKRDPPFGFAPKATIVHLNAAREAVLFTAVASAGGSGSMTLLSLLDLRNGNLVDLLPGVAISNQGEYKIWQVATVSSTAIVVTADAVWGDGETHFARHRFSVSAYALGSQVPLYRLRDQYVTAKKYPSFDEVKQIAVLEDEKPEILQRLLRQR